MVILGVLVGVVVLIMGRRLYWLFVGTAGFMLGIILATEFLNAQSDWVILVVALAAGVLGALLAVGVQRLAVAIAGLVGGGAIAVYLMRSLGWDAGGFAWVPFVVGAIVGLLLIATLFEGALIVLSSLSGASLILRPFDWRPAIMGLSFVVLVIVGITTQYRTMRRERAKATFGKE
jgi:hypothetical protein